MKKYQTVARVPHGRGYDAVRTLRDMKDPLQPLPGPVCIHPPCWAYNPKMQPRLGVRLALMPGRPRRPRTGAAVLAFIITTGITARAARERTRVPR